MRLSRYAAIDVPNGVRVEQTPFWLRAGMRQGMRRPFSTKALDPTYRLPPNSPIAQRIEAGRQMRRCMHGSLNCNFAFVWVCAMVCAGIFSIAQTELRFLSPQTVEYHLYTDVLNGYAAGGMRRIFGICIKGYAPGLF